jgi:anti-sigma B factor antagonist
MARMPADLTELILEHAYSALISMDEHGCVTAWNPSAERTFGIAREQALGRTVGELIVPERMRRRPIARLYRDTSGNGGIGDTMARPGRVEIREQVEGETVTLWVEGELDLSTIPVLSQQLDPHIAGHGHTALRLDLSAVTFMDSSGLRLLIELHERSRREGWGLTLAAPKHESATLVLRMTGADTALPFVDEAQS